MAMNGFEPLTCGIKVTAPPTEAATAQDKELSKRDAVYCLKYNNIGSVCLGISKII